MRGTWVMRNGCIVEKGGPLDVRHFPQRSSLPCPRLASDHMAPVQSMLDGRLYDSKSALRATYRAAGVTEVGNDPARLRPRQKPKTNEKAVRDTVEKAAARYARGERAM